jgi:hypothetical protein
MCLRGGTRGGDCRQMGSWLAGTCANLASFN